MTSTPPQLKHHQSRKRRVAIAMLSILLTDGTTQAFAPPVTTTHTKAFAPQPVTIKSTNSMLLSPSSIQHHSTFGHNHQQSATARTS
eukprot:scaffold17782_cov81-Skeletonema_dohrnii-CCMP3373.AAC.1